MEIITVFTGLLTLLCMATAIPKHITEYQLAKMRLKMEQDPNTTRIAISSTDKTISRRSILRLIIGMASILVSMTTLALLSFGPEKATALTNGNAASIAGALIMALFASIVVRGGD